MSFQQPLLKPFVINVRQIQIFLNIGSLFSLCLSEIIKTLLLGFVDFSSKEQLFNTIKSSLNCFSICPRTKLLAFLHTLLVIKTSSSFMTIAFKFLGLMKGTKPITSPNMLPTAWAVTLLFLVALRRHECSCTQFLTTN